MAVQSNKGLSNFLPLNSEIDKRNAQNRTDHEMLRMLMEKIDRKVKKIAKNLYEMGAIEDVDFIKKNNVTKKAKTNSQKKLFTIINSN